MVSSCSLADRTPAWSRSGGMQLHSRAVQEDGVLDDIITRLLAGRNTRPGKQVQLTEHEMRQLCGAAREIFMSQPNLLELEAPIKICGAHIGRVPLEVLPLACARMCLRQQV